MDLNPDELIKYVEGQPQYKNEVDSYYKSMGKLPEYDYSKFYALYPEYAEIITQGDGIEGLKVISLPDEEVSTAKGMIFSNTCDINLANQRKFSTRLLYAPIVRLSSYQALLEGEYVEGERVYSDEDINGHLQDIRKQKISQIFYLPASKYLETEAIIFFDQINSADNESVPREALQTSRMFSLSSYGWYVFLFRLSHFFTKLSDETVQLRFKPGVPR